MGKCLTCAKVKVEYPKPSGLLQQSDIPEWKWEWITLDFVTKLHTTTGGLDTIWVIVKKLNKSAHFLTTKETVKMEKLTRTYIKKLHDYMGCQYLSFPTEIVGSPHDFGNPYRSPWRPNST